MPKCYSEQEKEYIKNRLREEAAKCLAKYGIRRTTVDELVKRVKIPKGTFYLFYESKEQLLFEVILEQHEQVEQELFAALQSLEQTSITCDAVTDVLFLFYKKAEEMPILNMIQSGEVELLFRKLPPAMVEQHLQEDDSMVEKVFRTLPVKKEVDAETVSAAFHAIYYATLHKEEIGEKNYDEALHLLIKGLVMQFLEK